MSVNKVILIGNLGADPEVRHTQSGSTVCNLRMATNEKWKDRDGNQQERTEWHSISVFGNQAEACGKYLAKGRQVYVEGRLQSREYEDKEGVTRKVWDVVAEKVQFLSGGEGGGGGRRSGGGGGGGWGNNNGGNRSGGGGGGWGNKGGGRSGGGGGRSGGGGWGGNGGGGGGGQPAGGGKSGGDFADDPFPF